MKLRTFDNAGDFLATSLPTLLEREAENSLILGVVMRVQSDRAYGEDPPYLASVEDGNCIVAAAAMTPPYNLLICSNPLHKGALGLIAEGLNENRRVLPGVHGTTAAAEAFAKAWCAFTHAHGEVAMRQRSYRLTGVIPPKGVPGRLRPAESKDVRLLTGWAAAFAAEAIPTGPAPDVRALVDRLIEAGSLVVWDYGGPTSIAASSRPTPNGIAINLVYTPPQLRGRGYASACVAGLSQRLLDSGRAFCILFTDLTNPTSNTIYQRIGYRPIADFVEIRFHSTDSG